MKQDIYTTLIYTRYNRILGKLSYYLLKLLGIEIPLSVQIGKNFLLLHGGNGVVIHPKTIIGNNVRIYNGVSIGRADIHVPKSQTLFKGIELSDDTIICTGAKVLCKKGILCIGKGSVIGANSVLFQSTGEDEIWAGIPARHIGTRKREDLITF